MCYMIYLDNSATSFYKPNEVKQAIINGLDNYTANPGRSGHDLSLAVQDMVFDTRELIKKFFHAENYEVIFTKNCTEALNLAIFGMLEKGDHAITTCYEHNSVLRPLTKLESEGIELTILDSDSTKIIEDIENAIKPNTKLIVMTAQSNVTGEIMPIRAVGEIAKKHNVKFLVDGAQASGHIDINLTQANVDMYAFSGHKGLLSITGVGALIVKNGVNLKPLIYGGTGTNSESLAQPTNSVEAYESGTIPTIPILSLNAGIKYLMKNFDKIQKYEANLSKYLYFQLKKLKFLKIYSKENAKNVFCFNVGDLSSTLVAEILNEDYKICVRSGLHCAPLIHKKLGTIVSGAVRVSINHFTKYEEIDKLIEALTKIANL